MHFLFQIGNGYRWMFDGDVGVVIVQPKLIPHHLHRVFWHVVSLIAMLPVAYHLVVILRSRIDAKDWKLGEGCA